MSRTRPITSTARVFNYLNQHPTRRDLTPRQQRRIHKKANRNGHDSQEVLGGKI